MLSNDKKHIAYLDELRGKIISNTGGWFPGRGVFTHGYSMLEELIGEKSYFQLLILNATGKMVARPLADWVEAIYGCLSWPDPRIWCNHYRLTGRGLTLLRAVYFIGWCAIYSRCFCSVSTR